MTRLRRNLGPNHVSSSAPTSGRKPSGSAVRTWCSECLEHRTLLSVTAILNSGVLDVNLSAANDQALITPSGSTISVSGTGYSAQSFSGVTSLRGAGSQHVQPGRTQPERHIRRERRHDRSRRRVGHRRPLRLRRHVGDLHRRHDRRDLRRCRRRGFRDDSARRRCGTQRRLRSASRGRRSRRTTSRSTPVLQRSYTYTLPRGRLNAIGVAAAIANLEPERGGHGHGVIDEDRGQRGRRERHDRGRLERHGQHRAPRSVQALDGKRRQPGRCGDRRIGRQLLGDRPGRRRLDGQRRQRQRAL